MSRRIRYNKYYSEGILHARATAVAGTHRSWPRSLFGTSRPLDIHCTLVFIRSLGHVCEYSLLACEVLRFRSIARFAYGSGTSSRLKVRSVCCSFPAKRESIGKCSDLQCIWNQFDRIFRNIIEINQFKMCVKTLKIGNSRLSDRRQTVLCISPIS